MSKEMVISTSPHETKVALVEEGQVVEVYVEREKEFGLVGSIYKGRVTRVLPGMQSAFVDIGLDRDAFLYVSDFFEDLEEYEREAVAPVAEVEEPSSEAPPGESAEPAAEPEAQPELTIPEAGEATPPTLEPQPVQGEPAEEERQPDFVHHEPALRLPEQRPMGRGSGRGRRRHRGGRGRRRHGPGPGPGRGPLPPRPPEFRREPAPREPYEPIILPGESLAKYRERVPASPPPATEPGAPPAPTRLEEGPRPPETPEEARRPRGFVEIEEASSVEVSPAVEEAEEPVLEALPSAVPEEPAPEEKAAPETGSAAAAPEPQEAYPEAATLAEIERVRRYEDQVGLPPSLHDRTAGGVEWDRSRGRGDRGRPRGRRRHRGGRVRGRPGRDDRGPRGREERGRPGPRRMHARPSRGQPPISELLRAGQEIIVQIAKEQMGKKGARITSHVSLPGRYLVYMPTIEHVGVSRKIGTADERSRLRRLLLELKGNITGGFVVRTAATGCTEEDLRQDVDYLVKLWHDVRVRAEERPPASLLHRDLNLVERLLRDQLTPDYEAVWIDSEEEYAKVVEFAAGLQPALASRIKLYTKEVPIFDELGVQREIDRALQPKVWLKSGGYIVINHTEALVAIDVNTGKYVGKGSTRLEDTIVKTNLDAIKEIVRQIRLRDLGGIIIIDFIDMEDRRNRLRVMRALEDALRSDRSPSKVLGFNEFGLVAITRKRSRQSLERLLCQPCPTCDGIGMVKSIPTLCYEIQNEARKMAHTIDAPELTIRANPEIVKALKARESTLVRELEEQTGKSIILQPDVTLHFVQYNIY